MDQEKINLINLGFVNTYLVRVKDGFVLIDTGISSQKKKLEEQLSSFGCKRGNLKLVILTHGDMDHTGNSQAIKEKYSAKIAISKADYDDLKSGTIVKRKVKKFMSKIIFTVMFTVFKLMKSFKKNKTPKKLFEADIFLKDKQSLKEFGLDAEVLFVPGHTKGSIAIYTKEGDLFSGDTIVNNKKPMTAYIIENEDDLKKSIEILKKLKIRKIYPGHGKPFLREELKM